MSIEHFRLMALNNAWANATFYNALRDLPDGGLSAEAPGFFGSLKATLNHIWMVDLYYVDALENGGRGRSVYEQAELGTALDLAAAQADVDMRFARFCSDLTEEDLAGTRMTERDIGPVE